MDKMFDRISPASSLSDKEPVDTKSQGVSDSGLSQVVNQDTNQTAPTDFAQLQKKPTIENQDDFLKIPEQSDGPEKYYCEKGYDNELKWLLAERQKVAWAHTEKYYAEKTKLEAKEDAKKDYNRRMRLVKEADDAVNRYRVSIGLAPMPQFIWGTEESEKSGVEGANDVNN
jgi:hypothetical protein